MRRYIVLLILFLEIIFLYSQDILQGQKKIYSDIYYCQNNLYQDSISLNSIREKALLMRNVEWTPASNIPNNLRNFIKGKKVRGLPYSSVRELQKFIGLDVSIYTFLTAVNNPYSLLYTEDVAKGNPCYLGGSYNGTNCHTFYGTVCSSFTAFCYGENHNYTSYNYRNGLVPNYYLIPNQNIEAIADGNLIWSPGHVGLITAVEKDSLGHIVNIEVFESTDDKIYSRNYTPNAFLQRMSGNGNPKNQAYIYRNSLVERSGEPQDNQLTKDSIQIIIENLSFDNQEICTWFGDKPCIGEWDKLMINFNKNYFNRIIVSLNDEIVDTLDISNAEHAIEYKLKGIGLYKAQLASDTVISPYYTCFEVIDTTTKSRQNKEGLVEVIFAEDSNPEIVYWVDKTGDQLSFPITVPDDAKKNGKIIIKPCSRKDGILRVIYRGNYGRAINRPDYLFQIL